MPKEHERPGMFASCEKQRPLHILVSEQSLTGDDTHRPHRDRRLRLAQYHRVLGWLHTVALGTQLPHRAPPQIPATPPSSVTATSEDNTRVMGLQEQPHDMDQTLSQSSPYVRASSRNPNLNADIRPQHDSRDTVRNSVRSCEQSSMVGHTPLSPDNSDGSHCNTYQQCVSRPLPQQQSVFLAPPSTHAHQGNSTADRPSPMRLSYRCQNDPLPLAPSGPVVNHPSGHAWDVPARQSIARPHHRELYFCEQAAFPAPSCPPPPPPPPRLLELVLDQQPLALLPPTPTRSTQLTNQTCLLPNGETQPVELDAKDERVQQHINIGRLSEHPPLLPILPEIATSAPLYHLYVQARTWEFEDVTDAYNDLIASEGNISDRNHEFLTRCGRE